MDQPALGGPGNQIIFTVSSLFWCCLAIQSQVVKPMVAKLCNELASTIVLMPVIITMTGIPRALIRSICFAFPWLDIGPIINASAPLAMQSST